MSVLVLQGLLAASMLAGAEDHMRIGIRLQVPPQMPPALVAALKRETERHWSFDRIEIHWHSAVVSCQRPDHRLVVVNLRGGCTPRRLQNDDRVKPLGFTHVSDGHILPFVDLDCDAVAESVSRVAPPAAVFLNVDSFGRALAAVLTHEMVHALTESSDHAGSGVMQPQLSPRQLIESELVLAPETLSELEEALGVPLTSSQS